MDTITHTRHGHRIPFRGDRHEKTAPTLCRGIQFCTNCQADVATAHPDLASPPWQERISGGFFESCAMCGHEVSAAHADWRVRMNRHQDTHWPGRAADMVDGVCTICDDGGHVIAADDGMVCCQCGTRWDAEGRHGQTT